MKFKVLFLTLLVLFGIVLFSNNTDRELLTGKWNTITYTDNMKANGDSLDCKLIGRALFGSCRSVFVKDFAYVAYNGTLFILSITHPTNPTLISYFDVGGIIYDIQIIDTLVFLVNEVGGLRIINVSDPTNPVEVGFYDTPGYAIGVFALGENIYVADGYGGLSIIKYPVNTSGFYNEKYFSDIEINNYQIKYNERTIDIYFGIKERGLLKISMYDKIGREIKKLNNSIIEEGYTKISLNKEDYKRGVYFIKGKMGNSEIKFKILIY